MLHFVPRIQMMLALAMVTLVEPYLTDPNSTGDKHDVYKYYGTFTRAMLTLFETWLRLLMMP